jgi:hypothetical protein
LFLKKVNEPNPHARHFVFIGRADAATGRAYAPFAAKSFPSEINRFVVGHDEMRRLADFEQRDVRKTALFLQSIYLFHQYVWVDHDAIAEDAYFALVEHSGRNEANDSFLPVDDQGMTGVVTALKPHDDIGLLGEQVDHFSFAFIAPLNANYNESAHAMLVSTA